jgi:hypothetical protein
LITDTNRSDADPVLLRNLLDPLVLEQRRPGRSERTISFQKDPLLIAKRFQVVLRVVRVELDLVDRGDDFPSFTEMFEVGDGPVGNPDRLDFAGFVEGLHLGPGFGLVPLTIDRTCSVGVGREERRGGVGYESAVRGGT